MLRRLLIAPIRFYQRFLSPLKPAPTCRFLPTCSSYAIEAIERRGIVVGSLKALWRLLRCNPFCAGGYDPVIPLSESDATAEPGSAQASSTATPGDSRHHRADCDHRASHASEALDIESVRI